MHLNSRPIVPFFLGIALLGVISNCSDSGHSLGNSRLSDGGGTGGFAQTGGSLGSGGTLGSGGVIGTSATGGTPSTGGSSPGTLPPSDAGGVTGTGGLGAGGANGGRGGPGGTVGTGGRVGSGGNSGQGGALDASVSDANLSSDVAACGSQTCGSGQLCVHPSCAGGVAPGCLPAIDAGVCSVGYTYVSNCITVIGGAGSGPGCQPLPCVNPPPFCIDIPAACPAQPTCSCFSTTVCGTNGGLCMLITLQNIQCGAA